MGTHTLWVAENEDNDVSSLPVMFELHAVPGHEHDAEKAVSIAVLLCLFRKRDAASCELYPLLVTAPELSHENYRKWKQTSFSLDLQGFDIHHQTTCGTDCTYLAGQMRTRVP